MASSTRPMDFVRRTLALTAILGAGVAIASAQASPANSDAVTPSTRVLNLQVPAINVANDSLFSSSSTTNGDELAANTVHVPELNAMQYGGGRYGRPRYRGGNQNQDGSTKWAFLAGAGATIPYTGDSGDLTTSYGFQVGGGRNFSKAMSLIAQFDYDKFGFTGQTLRNQATVYGDPTYSSGLDGNTHIWSFSLNPTFNFYAHEGLGAYVVVGGGFYHKVGTFFITVPVCYSFYGCYPANQTIQNFTSNSPGANGGVGLTYKPSRFSGERLYAEIRVVHTFDKYRPGVDVNTPTAVASAYSGWNFFPQNTQETTYFPVKFGIRF